MKNSAKRLVPPVKSLDVYKRQETGDIEVVPTSIKVLGVCRYNELPFEINHSRDADEAQRLKYRYLDLRNPEVKDVYKRQVQGGY